MLPAHLQVRQRDDDDYSSDEDDCDDDNDSPRRRRRRRFPSQQARQRQQQPYYTASNPPLGLTGVLCDSKLLTVPNNRGQLHYTIFRPRSLAFGKPPLVCIAGGPCIPCTYLSPLVHLITDRSIILYDHLGTGQSSLQATTKATTACSQDIVNDMVNDFAFLMRNIPWKSENKNYHLFGHSFGGMIAYEYLRKQQQPQQQDKSSISPCCQSLILSSTPVSIPQVLNESQVLQEAIRQDLRAEEEAGTTTKMPKGTKKRLDDADNDLHEEDDSSTQVTALFSQRHECRVQPIPLPLEQAWQMAAYSSSANRGLGTVQDYTAACTSTGTTESSADNNSGPALVPSCLILRGQYDFVSAACLDVWWPLLQQQQQHQEPKTKKQSPEKPGINSRRSSSQEEEEEEEHRNSSCATSVKKEPAACDDTSHSNDKTATTAAATTTKTAMKIEMITLEGCSHYGMFENEAMYGSVLNAFLQKNDPESANSFIILPGGVKVRR